MDATTWLAKGAGRGTGGSSGSIGFSNSQAEYDYKKTGPAAARRSGSSSGASMSAAPWDRIDGFASDSSLQRSMSASRPGTRSRSTLRAGTNGALRHRHQRERPFSSAAIPPNGDRRNQGAGGGDPGRGIMSVQKVGMIVSWFQAVVLDHRESIIVQVILREMGGFGGIAHRSVQLLGRRRQFVLGLEGGRCVKDLQRGIDRRDGADHGNQHQPDQSEIASRRSRRPCPGNRAAASPPC